MYVTVIARKSRLWHFCGTQCTNETGHMLLRQHEMQKMLVFQQESKSVPDAKQAVKLEAALKHSTFIAPELRPSNSSDVNQFD